MADQVPIVLCPGCQIDMTPTGRKVVPDRPHIERITYTCPKCETTTTRMVKVEGS